MTSTQILDTRSIPTLTKEEARLAAGGEADPRFLQWLRSELKSLVVPQLFIPKPPAPPPPPPPPPPKTGINNFRERIGDILKKNHVTLPGAIEKPADRKRSASAISFLETANGESSEGVEDPDAPPAGTVFSVVEDTNFVIPMLSPSSSSVEVPEFFSDASAAPDRWGAPAGLLRGTPNLRGSGSRALGGGEQETDRYPVTEQFTSRALLEDLEDFSPVSDDSPPDGTVLASSVDGDLFVLPMLSSTELAGDFDLTLKTALPRNELKTPLPPRTQAEELLLPAAKSSVRLSGDPRPMIPEQVEVSSSQSRPPSGASSTFETRTSFERQVLEAKPFSTTGAKPNKTTGTSPDELRLHSARTWAVRKSSDSRFCRLDRLLTASAVSGQSWTAKAQWWATTFQPANPSAKVGAKLRVDGAKLLKLDVARGAMGDFLQNVLLAETDYAKKAGKQWQVKVVGGGNRGNSTTAGTDGSDGRVRGPGGVGCGHIRTAQAA